MNEIKYRPIGVIHTPFKKAGDAPIQGILAPGSKGKIEIYPEFTGGLRDIEGFSHLILLYHFHQSTGFSLTAKPFLDKETKGIFATRYFARPNSIGLTIVRLEKVSGNVLEISEIDMLDGTPLLDIKPYVPDFDCRTDVKDGWYRNCSERDKYLKSSGGKA